LLKFVGADDSLAFFEKKGKYAAVYFDTNLVADFSQVEIAQRLAALPNKPAKQAFSNSVIELANAALTEISPIAASGDRMYTIPEGVVVEAKKALEWRKKFKRGGTPVGLNTARTLARGGQIGIRKVRHIAKYFPRHEVDKKGKGWAPGEDKFPSNGRIAWALWGGDAAWRWSRAIVERENRKARTAGGYMLPGYEDHLDTYGFGNYDSDVNPFKIAHELDLNVGPEFMARVRMDGSGIDRLYKIDIDGTVSVWDDFGWDDLGHVDGDVYYYDQALDNPEDNVEVEHVLIDPSSAVIISAFMQERPFQPVLLEEIDPEETALMAEGLAEEDFGMIDRVLTAAGVVDQDGNYTPEERSALAKGQPRDASGKFAKVGTKVVIAQDYSRGKGEITAINSEDGTVDVLLDNGKSVTVPSNSTKELKDSEKGYEVVNTEPRGVPLDVSGILGEPRTPSNMPKAHLPGTLPPMSREDLSSLMRNWDSWVLNQRKRFKPIKSSVDPQASGTQTPSSSDISAKYLAIVSPDDKSAVMDIVAIVPETKETTTPVLYERKEGKWVKNDQILLDLKSATPPPVVEIDDKEVLNDVLSQADQGVTSSAYSFDIFWEKIVDPITAAGGLDRNRGNAEALRRYWTRGKGALKIRWGTPGDWTRCVRQLSKYMGPRAKGYCQLRHKEVTGVYTGSKYNVGKKRGRQGAASLFASEQDFDSIIIQRSELAARAADAREKIGLVASAPKSNSGARFYIPILIPEETESGDGRKFKKGAISTRELPVPLLWQIKTGSGHDGSVVVGRIDYIERIDGGMGNAYGVFDNGPYGREAERLVRHGFLRGVSVDLDQFEAKEDKQSKKENSDDAQEYGKDKLTINKARIMAATIVAKPAFQECSILIEESGDQEDIVTPEDGVYEESLETFTDVEPVVASGYLESEIPVTPSAAWFENPKLTKPTPLTVDKDGRIYGHIAAWHVNHIGLPRSTKPPRSRSKYAYFHTGVIHTAEGMDIPVGQLTLAGGHAPLNVDAAAAAKHYDDTASAVADVHVGEDEYGIWCAGSLRPDVDELQVRALRASAPSGDWRPINGALELVAVCQVNVPGFPIARAMIASGKIMALVAAGASELAIMKSRAVGNLVAQADMLAQLAATAPNLKNRVREAKKKMREANLEAITASAAELREKALTAAAIAELAKISQEERMALAKEGKAMPDGAYPIRNVEDLKNAIQAYGRSKASERKAVRKHIIKRARQLRQADLIPSHWLHADSMEAAEKVAAMRAAITAAATVEADTDLDTSNPSYIREVVVAAGPKVEEISETELKKLKKVKEEADKQTEEEIEAAEEVEKAKSAPARDEEGRIKYISGVNQPRDAKGKYRKVLARLKQDLGVAGLSRALKKVEDAENLDFAGDYSASAAASSELLGMIDRLDAKALNPEALENVRLTAAELGKTIANLPLPFGKEAEKVRYSDLPTGLKDLIEGMIDRVESKIGKEDADIATQKLKSYMSGADVFSQGEVQSEMSKLLRLLT
jgi:hypothetical protein